MKAVLITVMLVGLFCCNPANGNLESFMPGTYVRNIAHEFSRGRDTLHIVHLKRRAYLIERTGSFQRISNGHLLQVERKKESWAAVFDAKTGIMQETKRGRIILFDQDRNRLLVGSSVYQKIN